jgi:hypothetical protein
MPLACAVSTADIIFRAITTTFIPTHIGIIPIRIIMEQVFTSDIIFGIRRRAGDFTIVRVGIIRRGRIIPIHAGVLRGITTTTAIPTDIATTTIHTTVITTGIIPIITTITIMIEIL